MDKYFSSESRPVIDFPLRGEWRYIRAPGHHASAFDFMKSIHHNPRSFQIAFRISFFFQAKN